MREPRSVERPGAWAAPDPLPLRVETERLVVRPWTAGDGAALFGVVDRWRVELGEWLPWTFGDHRSVAESEATLRRFGEEAGDPLSNAVVLGILDRATGEVVGGTGLHGVEAGTHCAEVGYWIRPDRWGEGLCPEAVGGWVGCLLRGAGDGGWGLRRVRIQCDARNRASWRVIEKLGLRFEGHRRGDMWAERGDGWRSTFEYGVLHDEWDHGRGRARDGIGWGAGFGREGAG